MGSRSKTKIRYTAVATVKSSESDAYEVGDSVEIEIGEGDSIDDVADFIMHEFNRTKGVH